MGIGPNANHLFGVPSTEFTQAAEPFPIPLPGAALGKIKIAHVAVLYHVLATTGDGATYSWGAGDRGQLGHGSLETRVQPKEIDGLKGKHIVQLACGNKYSAAITDKGELYVFANSSHLSPSSKWCQHIFSCDVFHSAH